MGRKLVLNAVKINSISEEMESTGVSIQLMVLWTGVSRATVHSWRSNTTQPKGETVNLVCDLFEKDFSLLLEAQNRKPTGLAQALQMELKRLMKIEKIPFEVEVDKEVKKGEAKSESDAGADSPESKKSTKTINPLLVEKIKAFAEEYKKNNPPVPLTYFDKPLSKITKEELKGLELFICDSEKNSGSDKLRYQVISIVKDVIQVVANFAKITDAKNYVDLIQRGYIELSEE